MTRIAQPPPRLALWIPFVALAGFAMVLGAQHIVVMRPDLSDWGEIGAGILEAIGIAFITSVVVSLITDYIYRGQIAKDFSEAISVFYDGRFYQSKAYGFNGIRGDFEDCNIFNKSSHRIQNKFSLQGRDELFCLLTWDTPFEFGLMEKHAVESNVKFRLLVLHPDAQSAILRGRELGRNEDDVEGAIAEFLRKVKRVRDSSQNVKVKTFGGWIGTPMFIIVREGKPIYAWTSFLFHKDTEFTPHLCWTSEGANEKSSFLHLLKEYFDMKWENANPHPEMGTVEQSNLFGKVVALGESTGSEALVEFEGNEYHVHRHGSACGLPEGVRVNDTVSFDILKLSDEWKEENEMTGYKDLAVNINAVVQGPLRTFANCAA